MVKAAELDQEQIIDMGVGIHCNATLRQHLTVISPEADVYRPIIIGIMTFLIISSNLINILVLPRMSTLSKTNRIFFVSLGVADLVVGLSTGIPAFVTSLRDNEWVFGDVFCGISALMFNTSAAASVITLSVISFQRWLAVIRPMKYRLTSTKTSLRIMIAIWAYSVGIWTIPLVDEAFVYQLEPSAPLCLPCLNKVWASMLAGSTTIFICPFILISTSLGIICSLRKYRQPGEQLTNIKSLETKATKLLLTAAGLYIACWTPYSLFVITRFVKPSMEYEAPVWVKFALRWSTVSNSFMNVCIYSFMYEEFRKKTKDIFTTNVFCAVDRRSVTGLNYPS